VVVHDGNHRGFGHIRGAGIASPTSMLLMPGEIHEGHLRHARKTLSNFFILLIDDTVTSFIASVIELPQK
jgi:hypothetical protein